ncbi:MAG: glutaredoxin 3 [Alphaproteobacteria bacterium]|nr:glutaredoxin 3 [Alphaproteobacteria bacterium]
MAKVEIYSKSTCPYCVRAKALLESKGVEYTEYDVAANEDIRNKMLERAPGVRTVPQIFINDKHYGGCDDLHALDAKGELDTILNG